MREAISKPKTQTWHRILIHYLPLYFPEIERFTGNSRYDWFLALIERFPTPSSIISIGREVSTEQAWPLIGRKVSKADWSTIFTRPPLHRSRCRLTKIPLRSRCSAWSSLRFVS